MNLQKLVDCYDRLVQSPNEHIAVWGFGMQRIHFALRLNKEGELLQVIDLRQMRGKKLRPSTMIVPEGVIRTHGIKPNFLWDNAGYMLGADSKAQRERAAEQFESFKRLHHEVGDGVDDSGMAAVLRFLDSWDPESAEALEYWDEIASQSNLVFQLEDEFRYVHDRPAIQAAWLRYYENSGSTERSVCLISGSEEPVARLHPKIKCVEDSNASGAQLASFEPYAFRFHAKSQGLNAPIGEKSAFRYAAALNHLLRPYSKNRIQIGDATTVFWTERDSPIEGFLGFALHPDKRQLASIELATFLRACRDGKPLPAVDDNIMCYILGLSSNGARIAVRFWNAGAVADFSRNLGQHFRDLLMVRRPGQDPEFPEPGRLLRALSHSKTHGNISLVLTETLMRAVLTGLPYPDILLSAALARFASDHKRSESKDYLRAAMIKAVINRKNRIQNREENIPMALNTENKEPGYLLGRLFAVLEKAQKDAHKVNTTIRDSYFSSAMTSPNSAFPQLLRLAQHHISKADFGWYADQLIEGIMQDLSFFPRRLTQEEQGLFAIGYYQQRHAFYNTEEGHADGLQTTTQ